MQLIRGFHNLKYCPQLMQGCALTIGNFDGVHQGHQNILARLLDQSLKLGVPSVVMLFEPQPREFFANKAAHTTIPARLMRLRDKFESLKELGVDFVLCVPFNQKFAQYSAESFIEELLVKKLKIRYLSIGDDFHFGANRLGDFSMLYNASLKNRFIVEKNPTYLLNGQRISSSLIREALRHDDLNLAKTLLGKAYTICGRVVHGRKLGRTLTFPTANINLNRLVIPVQGVYAVQVKVSQQKFDAIANVGNRPTINGAKPLLEVHIFNFNQNIYHQKIEVSFYKKIRNEMKFPDLLALKQQIAKDIQAVRSFFNFAQQDL